MKKARNLGIGFTGSPYNALEIAKLAKAAEKAGFASLWIAEDYFFRDAVTLLSCAAVATSSIELGIGVINPFTRHPALVAQTAATLYELSKGRFKLGLGVGEPSVMQAMGIDLTHPLSAMREAVQLIRALLSGKRAALKGRRFSMKAAKLGTNPYISYPEDTFLVRGKIPVQIYLAAIGPKMLGLAAKLADGVLLSAGIPASKVKEASSLARKSRPRSAALAGYVMTALGSPPKSIKRFAACTAYYSPASLTASGIEENRIEAISEAFRKQGIAAATAKVSEEVVSAVAACGSLRAIEAKIEEFRDSGLEQPILLPMETKALSLIEKLGTR